MCSQATPCITIMKALATNRPYIKLHGAIDEAVTINDRSVTLLADPDTTLTRGGAGNIVTIDGTSNVKIYDLAINGASGNGSGILLPSGSMQTVTLGRVSMTGNNGALAAVVASGGTIHIQRSRIFNNASGGISIAMAQFDIENNFITGNGTDGTAGATPYGGVSLFQTNTGMRTLSFNTISGNKGGLDAATGVSCAQVTQDLTASNNIIYGNLVQGIGAQVSGNHCLWTYSDIGPGAVPAGTSNRSDDPMFTPGDFHLQSISHLIDQADPAATLGVDIDGDPRPQNGRRDIGADEYIPPH